MPPIIPFSFNGIAEIPFGSERYALTVALRYDILRKPLGLHFTAEQLSKEDKEFHIAYIEEGKVLGCLILTPKENGIIKMRQVAVAVNQQGKGIGKKMVIYSEIFSKEKGFITMDLNARKTAIPFYLSMNYKTVGDEFEEVTIPHFRMVKSLI
jgi:predicted GNAT family N-acyltransferase